MPLPDDVAALKALLAAATRRADDAEARESATEAVIAHLKLQIAELTWEQYGASAERTRRLLGGVDKFEPVSGGGKMDHPKEAVGKLVVARSDGTVGLEMTEHAFNPVALLVERTVMLDLHASA
jgi:hypothetical protein